MDPRPFRPAVAELESRLVPASDAAVVAAYTATVTTTDDLSYLATHLQVGRTAQAISSLQTQLPAIAAQSRANAGVLSEYRRELQAAANSNPGLGESFQRFLMQVAGAEVQAQLNGIYADTFAIGFGAPPPVPPPPPPPPNSNPVFGVDTTNAATTAATTPTTTTTTPTTSTLPFSLSDPNFRTQADGTKVWDVTPGTGATVTTGSPVTLNYTGYLTNGTKFDSSFDRNTPLVTTLSTSNLIPGFVSGVSGMQVGGVRRIFIPSALGYGSTARTGIPANSDLVFEITLVSSP